MSNQITITMQCLRHPLGFSIRLKGGEQELPLLSELFSEQ